MFWSESLKLKVNRWTPKQPAKNPSDLAWGRANWCVKIFIPFTRVSS